MMNRVNIVGCRQPRLAMMTKGALIVSLPAGLVRHGKPSVRPRAAATPSSARQNSPGFRS